MVIVPNMLIIGFVGFDTSFVEYTLATIVSETRRVSLGSRRRFQANTMPHSSIHLAPPGGMLIPG